MKGSLHTDELMREVTSAKTGRRTARRISHVFIMDVPTYADTLFITDAAINIFPDLDAKRDIIQNAIDLSRPGRRRRHRAGGAGADCAHLARGFSCAHAWLPEPSRCSTPTRDGAQQSCSRMMCVCRN